MTKNQKIALGCGGAGCLGLIVVAIAGGAIWFMMRGQSGGIFNSNVTTNRNANSETDSNSNVDSNSNSSTSTSATSLSDDDKHKLYQAATMTGDTELLRRVSVKLGLMNADFTPGDDYVEFVKDHVVWAFSNGDFIQSMNTKEKAVAYVNEHFPD